MGEARDSARVRESGGRCPARAALAAGAHGRPVAAGRGSGLRDRCRHAELGELAFEMGVQHN